MATLDDIIAALGSAGVSRARREYDDAVTDARRTLSRSGVYASPAATLDYFADMDERLHSNLAQLLPQLQLQGYQLGQQQRARAADELFRERQYAAQLDQQREAARQFDVQAGFRERELTLAELIRQAQAEAARRMAGDWTTPLLQGLASAAGLGIGKSLADLGLPLLASLFGGKK